MKRREFMVAASGVSGGAVAATAATPVAAQEDENGDGTETNGDDETENDDAENGENGDTENGNGNGAAAGGGTEYVEIGDNYFEPDELTIEPGTTVVWEWVGEADHNIDPDDDQPEGADWEGHTDLKSDGDYEHTFDVEGTYDYVCTPHVGVGMIGSIDVTEDADEAAAVADVDIHELGVPIQKHFVGIASFLAIFVSLVFTFYLLKYGESANTSSPGRK